MHPSNIRSSAWPADVKAGLNGALIGIPQEINYGLLAFGPLGAAFALPGVIAAFAASIFGCLIYCLLGAGRNQLVGPRPTLVVLVASFLVALIQHDFPLATLPVALVLMMLLVAGLLFLFAHLGLGHLFKYLPVSVLAGFTHGIALTLIVAAIPMALGTGYRLPQVFELASFHPASLTVAAVTVIVCLHPLRFGVFRFLPAVLQALIAAFLLQEALVYGSSWFDGPRIGELLAWPGDALELLPGVVWPELELRHLVIIGKFALAIAMAAALETLATTTSLESDHLQQSAGKTILNRLAWTHLLLSPFMMPVAASLGRSVALVAGGGQSRWAQLLYALFLLLLVVFGFRLIAALPQAAIAGVLIVVARNMMVDTLRLAWRRVRRAVTPGERGRYLADFGVIAGVGLITLLDGFISGLAIGIVAAMALFIRDQSRSVVRRVQFGDVCRSLRIRSETARRMQAQHGREIVIVSAEGPLFFGSMERLLARMDELVPAARVLILDLQRTGDIDQTACQLLRQAARRYREQGCRLCLAHVASDRSRARMLRTAGVDRDLPPADWYVDLDVALEQAEDDLLLRYGLSHDDLKKVDLMDSDLARGVTVADAALLAAQLTIRRLVTGERLFGQGEAGNSLFLIRSGAISIRLEQPQGGTRLIAFGPGALFGEMALISGAPRSAGAFADEDSELFELTRDAFEQLQASHPQLAVQLLQRVSVLLSDRLRHTTQQLHALLTA